MASTLWVEKYRPKRLAEVEHHEDVKCMLQTSLRTGELPHLLFYGPAGTGKTSVIMAFAREMYEPQDWSTHVLELNASDERGIEVVRERVKNFSKFMSRQEAYSWKLVILDECDMMTTDAQSALRRVMEDYSKHTRFVLICNYLTKIVDAIASRCAKTRFEALPPKAQIHKLKTIVRNENLSISDAALDAIAKKSRGDLRMAINVLQNCAYLPTTRELTETDVLSITGSVEEQIARDVLTACRSGDFTEVNSMCHNVVNQGVNVTGLFEELVTVISEDQNMTDTQKSMCVLKLGVCDKRLAVGASEHLQLLAFAGAAGVVLQPP